MDRKALQRLAADFAPDEPAKLDKAPKTPTRRYASLGALRSDGYESAGHGIYRRAHHLWTLTASADGSVEVHRLAPEPSADSGFQDRSLAGKRARVRLSGRVASVTIVHVDGDGLHVEYDSAEGVTESAVVPAEDLVEVCDWP